ncbi:MAG: hypothetical protein PHV53_10945 [Fermentimonas sp.]|nr:hypothetical protein [Fermentimonas sp.]
MNTEQLEKAKKTYGYAMTITLKGNKLLVAKDGYITDNQTDITAKKKFGEFNGFFYQFTKKGYINELIAVIKAISEVEAVIA